MQRNKILKERFTEGEYTYEELVNIMKEKMFSARVKGLYIEFICSKPVFDAKGNVIGTEFTPAVLSIYEYK